MLCRTTSRPSRGARGWLKYFFAFVLLTIPEVAAASGGHGIDYTVWLALAGILLVAKLGAEAAARLNQPGVLGELVAGIALGNLHLIGIHVFHEIPHLASVEFLAELGVVLLLFEVGLESTLTEMKEVAPQSGLVAILGVVAPIGLGYAASYVLLPDQPQTLHLFVGATLCATSVGITARVLQQLDAMQRVETRVILGAAVIDDVLGLIALAVVSAIAEKGAPTPSEVLMIVLLAVVFYYWVGHPRHVRHAWVLPSVCETKNAWRAGRREHWPMSRTGRSCEPSRPGRNRRRIRRGSHSRRGSRSTLRQALCPRPI